MGKNAYAVKLMAMKAAMSVDEKRMLVRRNMTTIYHGAAIALNNEFGFGAERIARFHDALDKTLVEYGVEMDNNDVEYADAKLEEAYLRIMGEYYKEEGK